MRLPWSVRATGEARIHHLVALAAILASLPLFLFFWIGTRTFLDPGEKRLAVVMTWFAAGLILLSLAAFYDSRLATANAAGLAAALAVYLGLWLYSRRRR